MAMEEKTEEQLLEETQNAEYYFRIAKRFRIIMFSLILVLVVFVTAMFSSYREEITVENLRYFLKYIDTRQAEKKATADTIYHSDIDSIVRFGIYRNGLAVVGYDKIQVYDLAGEAILDLTQSNASPQLLCSDQYMLVYNLGGTTFQVYNSLSKEYEESFPYGIGGAALSDSGTFLIVTRTMEYRSAVYVYNKNFEQIYRWYTPDKLIMDAAFKKGDKEFIIAALGTGENGLSYTEILLCQTGKEEKKAQFRIEDEVIYRVRYTGDGGYVLIGGKAIYFYDKNSELVRSVSYGSFSPTTIDTTGEYTYYSMNKNIVGSNYEVTVTDGRGEIIYVGNVNGEISKLMIHDGALYVLLDRSIMRISMETGNQIVKEIDTNCITIQALDKNTLMLCYADQTKVIDINSFFFGGT